MRSNGKDFARLPRDPAGLSDHEPDGSGEPGHARRQGRLVLGTLAVVLLLALAGVLLNRSSSPASSPAHTPSSRVPTVIEVAPGPATEESGGDQDYQVRIEDVLAAPQMEADQTPLYSARGTGGRVSFGLPASTNDQPRLIGVRLACVGEGTIRLSDSATGATTAMPCLEGVASAQLQVGSAELTLTLDIPDQMIWAVVAYRAR